MCALLGRWDHPDDMLEELTLPQYDGWVRYLKRYNLFPDRNDLLFAILTTTVANQWAGRGDRVKPYEVMPYLDPEVRKQYDADPYGLDAEITQDELAFKILAVIG